MKESAGHRGFTLVELLITMVVIGILSTMMILSSKEAVSSAKAADIISDLTNIRTAALAYLADHIEDVEKDGKYFQLANKSGDIMKYLDKSTLNAYNKYQFNNRFSAIHDDEDMWYVLPRRIKI